MAMFPNLIVGVCNHAFHFHCISRLDSSILSGSSCADNSEWDFQKYGH
ncbi:hypothetical protein CK203_003308 [Vitis vinifera]|uniref:Uncharacterized protein n=1 Tax=Vitis vinifera TaxID=29760 RepID=A0A438K6W5_VITVI|nr:hypothetical protein CK203_003308 [Vitis vinifera]